jgi:DNA-binding transcriptional ArsR family regulator
MSSEPGSRSLLIDESAHKLRRSLGPTAWMVLEEMLLRSSAASDGRVARVSVRAIAGSLGLSKDTAARAIRRLRETGVVTAIQRRTTGGVFDAGVYVITITPDTMSVKMTAVVKPRPRAIAHEAAQLPLALEA